MPRTKRQELTYKEAVFAWMADWQPSVRVLDLAEDGSWVSADPNHVERAKPLGGKNKGPKR